MSLVSLWDCRSVSSCWRACSARGRASSGCDFSRSSAASVRRSSVDRWEDFGRDFTSGVVVERRMSLPFEWDFVFILAILAGTASNYEAHKEEALEVIAPVSQRLSTYGRYRDVCYNSILGHEISSRHLKPQLNEASTANHA